MNQDKIQGFLQELPLMREDLPFSPEVLQQLFVQSGNGSLASMEDVGETLSKDQGLTARILKLANSAYYGLQAEVQSVSRAAAVLGMAEIRNIVLALGVTGLTRRYSMPEDFDLGRYWAHQFMVAMVARELSHMIDVGKPENLFTSGLLHDFGKLVTALKRPEDWAAIRELAESDEMTDSEAEEEYWGWTTRSSARWCCAPGTCRPPWSSRSTGTIRRTCRRNFPTSPTSSAWPTAWSTPWTIRTGGTASGWTSSARPWMWTWTTFWKSPRRWSTRTTSNNS
jgi:hypothetical protein